AGEPADSRRRGARSSRSCASVHDTRGACATSRARHASRLGYAQRLAAAAQQSAAAPAALRLFLQPSVCSCLLLPWLALVPLPHPQAVQTGLAALGSLVDTFRLALPI